jgi:hypothetical protein
MRDSGRLSSARRMAVNSAMLLVVGAGKTPLLAVL